MQSYLTVLSIAGSDPSAGAGVQADLKTCAALGCYGLSVITALTAQNTKGVQAAEPISSPFIQQQLESIFDDIYVSAVKLGMLHNEAVIQVVSKFLAQYPLIPCVLDPVMLAKGGHLLLEENAVQALIQMLFPLASLLTPNLPEAEVFLNRSILTERDMEAAAYDLAEMGAPAVLLKGGHLNTEQALDCLYIKKTKHFRWFEAPRIHTENTHGTGCTLSAAIAAFLAQGFPLEESVFEAKAYLSLALNAGKNFRLGAGHGPVQHFFK